MKFIKLTFILLPILIIFSCGDKYTFNENWKFNTKKNTAQIQFQAHENLYISAGEYLNKNSPNHLLYCLDSKTGKVKWKFDIGNTIILQDIKLLEGKILLKSINDEITWLNAKTGIKLKYSTQSNIPKTSINYIYSGSKVVSIKGNENTKKPAEIACINNNGKTLWTYKIKPLLNVKRPYEVNFSFLIDGKNLIIANYDGEIRSIKVEKLN